MHYLLEKLLNKRKIESINQLSTEEKAQFDSWQGILTNEPVTIPKLVEFLTVQKNLIEAQFGLIENTTLKNDRLILQHAIYSKILKLMDADRAEREALEKYLTSLVDSKDT